MKINLDDPNLTAYALGELSGAEKSAVAAAVAASPEAQAYVDELRQFSGVLREEFRADLERAEAKQSNILPLPSPRSFWSDARWMSMGVAALLAIATVIAAVALSSRLASNVTVGRAVARGRLDVAKKRETPPVAVQMEVFSEDAKQLETPVVVQNRGESVVLGGAPIPAPMAAPQIQSLVYAANSQPQESSASNSMFNTAEYDQFDENPFLPAATNPLSTFSVDVDTASYANVRRFINSGSLPPRDAVRVEEMINYFTYDYPQPTGDEPFSINLEIAGCPWQPAHRLVRIGLKGREVAAEKRGASNLVFLLDVSGSMGPAARLPLIKQSMRLLVDRLTENDRVAIVIYAAGSGMVLPSTPGNQKEKILAALENLEAGGSTNGAEGIELAYKIAAENFIKGGVNRVILATDGDFNVGVTSQGDLVRLAEAKAKSGVFLTVLGVGDDNLRDSTMQKLADKGNGNYAYLDSLEEARKVLVQQMNGTLVTIAKDVKVQVEFNTAQVASYRLIGYEKRMLRKEDFNNDKVDAGEIGAGHTVTALYEVVPVGEGADPAASVPAVDPLKYPTSNTKPAADSPELLTVKLRYKQPDGDKSQLIERTLVDAGNVFSNASKDLKFVAAVAEFGMILRQSPHKGDASLTSVLSQAEDGAGRDEAGYRAGFIELVRKAQSLAL